MEANSYSLLIKKIFENKGREPTMTPEQFFESNESVFYDLYSADNEWKITDENFEQYADEVRKNYLESNRPYTQEMMKDLYMYSICEC